MSKLYAKIRSGSFVAMVANIIYLFSRLGVTPFILSYVSLAAYGLWSFCFVILSYAGMSAFGIHNSYIKYTAEYFQAKEFDKINGLFSTGLMIMGGYALLFFLILTVASPWIISFFDIEVELVPLARALLIGTAAVFLIDLSLGAFRAILEGLQEIAVSKGIWLLSTLLEVVLIVIFLQSGTGLMGVMYAYIIKTLVDIFAHMVAAFRFLPSLKISFSLINKRYYHELFVFGGKVQVLGLLGMFLGSLDRIFITSMLGLNATGIFELGRKLPFTARSITGAASAPFLPAASAMVGEWKYQRTNNVQTQRQLNLIQNVLSRFWYYISLCIVCIFIALLGLIPYFSLLKNKLEAFDIFTLNKITIVIMFVFLSLVFAIVVACSVKRQWLELRQGEYYDAPELRKLYLHASRYINLINAVLYGFIMATAPQLLYAWLGEGYSLAYVICLVIAIKCFIHLATLPCSTMMRGVNRSGRELEAILINLILLVIWAPIWTQEHGIMGTVWAFTLSTVISSIYFLARTNAVFGIETIIYYKKCIKLCLYPAIIAVSIALLATYTSTILPNMGRWETLCFVGILGVLYISLCGVALWRYCLSSDECQILKSMLKKKV